MTSPKSFEEIEDDFRGKLLDTYSQDWALTSAGRSHFIRAGGAGPAALRATMDCPSKPFYAIVNASLGPQLVNLWASGIGYHFSKKQSIEVGLGGIAKYSFADDTFNVAATTNSLDGFPTDASVSTRLSNNTFAGASISYDASRSGLKNYTLTVATSGVKELKNADILAKLDATEGYGLGLSFPIRSNVSLTALLSRREQKVGARYSSSCGAAVTAFIDAASRSLGLSATRGTGSGWKVGVSATLAANAPLNPTFGVSLSSE